MGREQHARAGRRVMFRIRRRIVGLAVALVAALVLPGVTAAATPYPPYVAPDADWLTVVNYYRSMAGLTPVTEDPTFSAGAYNHSCYMLYNGITHDETSGLPGYSVNGDQAGNNGNVAVSSAFGSSARNHVELWMTGPFHAIGVLRYNLQRVGFGKCDLNTTPTWHSGATLNVLNGLNPTLPRPPTPIVFPGNGTTTNLSKFVTETPNPLTYCGWTGAAGLPVIAMMPEKFTTVSATITGPTGVVPNCALSALNTTSTAQAILGGDNAVTVIPRVALDDGTYTVTVTTNVRSVTWSFTVDQNASLGLMPLPTVTPSAGPSAYTAVSPFRLADSRITYRVTSLQAGVVKRLQIAGVAGIPTDATALSANFTLTNENGNGFLTVYNCTTNRPLASTLNYYTSEVTHNAGLFPLGPSGELCLYSMREAHIVIDVTGYFQPSSNLRFEGLEAAPLVDSTVRLNVAGRLMADQTISVNVPAAGVGVPADARAVAVNITGIWPDSNGYLTAYECGATRPLISNVNPTVGTTKQNFAIVPLSPSGEMCLYTMKATDVKIDVLGYFTPSAAHTMIPTTPTRVIDTRENSRVELNFGNAGGMIPANTTQTLQLAGQRGIPANATVVSVNVIAVDPSAAGSMTFWDCTAIPPIQSINFSIGKIVANAIQVQLSAGGTMCVRSTVPTHVVIDVTGWWS